MDGFVKYLEDYNRILQPFIDEVFEKEKAHAAKIAPMASGMIDDYKEFLNGGKKLRGAEIFLGYEMFGGQNKNEGLRASLTIEIIHSFLLMHDDIMDRDSLRRGKPTMHKKYAQIYGEHFGVSMAMDMGDEGAFFAYYLLNSLDLSRERLSRATQFLSRLLMETGLGQAMDITFEMEKRFNEESVLQVHRYKTAEYTISGPISIGAILAGVSDDTLRAIKDFGIPVGVAFQLRDDELGMFSTEEELGKPVDSDLRENKVTILIVKAFELAKGEDLKFLKYAYGNHSLTKEAVEKVREIMKKVGALDYSQKLSKKLVEEGKKFIPKITNDPKYQQLLSELADFVIERKN